MSTATAPRRDANWEALLETAWLTCACKASSLLGKVLLGAKTATLAVLPSNTASSRPAMAVDGCRSSTPAAAVTSHLVYCIDSFLNDRKAAMLV